MNSFWGEVYFRVARHLGVGIVTVIKNKFLIEYKTLIMYYSIQLRHEIKAQKKLEDEQKKLKSKG